MTVSLMPSTSLTEGMADIESFDGMFTPQSGGPDDTIEKETSIDNANGVKGGTMDKEKGWMRRIGDTLAKRGIEDRGVVPCPEDVGDVRSTTYNVQSEKKKVVGRLIDHVGATSVERMGIFAPVYNLGCLEYQRLDGE